jgi:hypothetical protein
MNPSSDEVCDSIASALGEGPSRSTLAAQRVLVIEMAERRFRPRPSPNARAYVLAAVLVVAVVAAVGARALRPEPFAAHFRGSVVAVDAPLIAAASVSSALDFSDGSEVIIERNSRATLAALTPKHAGVRLDAGRMSASIRKHPGMTWTVTAGPYAVHVVGTRFSVEWDERTRAFAVNVSEGRVRVTGGDLPSSGVLLDQGGRLERRAGGSAANATPSSSKATERAEPAPPDDEVVATHEIAAKSPEAKQPTVAFLAAKGKYREALALAERQGFSRLTLELPENDLLLLANAARYSGDAGRAREALGALRERFKGRPASSLAALYLAKIEPARAVHWLRVFLSESPRGDLAVGARADLMSLLVKSGDESGARAIANEYLRYHPNGPHAAEARALLAE